MLAARKNYEPNFVPSISHHPHLKNRDADKEIAEKLNAKEQAGIVLLNKQYSAYCKKIIFNVLHNKLDTEECLNDLWMHIWMTPAEIDADTFFTYLTTSARNCALNYRRTKSYAERLYEKDISLEELEPIIQTLEDTETCFEEKRVLGLFSKFLMDSKERDRTMFLQYYCCKYSMENVGKIHGVSKMRVSEILKKMRHNLLTLMEEQGVVLTLYPE